MIDLTEKIVHAHNVEISYVCNFSIAQILREINLWDSSSAKSAHFTHSEALDFDLYEVFHFCKTEIYQIKKLQCPENFKTAVLELLICPKLISRKI